MASYSISHLLEDFGARCYGFGGVNHGLVINQEENALKSRESLTDNESGEEMMLKRSSSSPKKPLSILTTSPFSEGS